MKKIIVVGAGIMGASTAYQLAKRGAKVTIVDRKDYGQATDAAAGIVCPWLTQRRNKEWYNLAVAGARFYPELIEELKKDGETETGYEQVGALSLQKDTGKLEKMMTRAFIRKETAPEMGEIRLLTEQETNSLFPSLDPDFRGVHVSGAARVDGRALRDSLLRGAIRNGADFIQGDAALLQDGRKIIGVTVDEKQLFSETVVVCAGAWAKSLFSPIGINFKVSFQKAQIVHLELPNEDTSVWPVIMPPGNQYILAFNGGKIVAGATHEDLEEFDTRVTVGGLHEVFGKMLETAPGLHEGTFLEARVGYRPHMPDFLPVVGPIPGWEGIFAANGLGASGLTIGPYLGKELAKLILGSEVEIDLEAYSIAKAIE